jgi:Rad3-related DNA helicase
MGPYFVIPKLDIDNLRSWIDFLITLQEDLLKRVKISNDLISDISNEYKQLLSRSGDLERLKSIIQLIQTTTRFKELSVNAQQDIDRLIMAISTISSEPQNWIVSDLKFDAKSKDVVKVEFKPLDVSKFCKSILEKGKKVLMMSATILDSETFSQDIGLAPNDVKIIKVGSTFPIENRQIHPLNIAKLNKDTWAREEVKLAIVRAIDKVMSHFKDRKGLIHCTSYDQLYFIIANISQENKRRLLKTDPDKERDLVIEKHIDSIEPTVLISPSLHLGIDLKDDLSRFQIIVKLPYANLGDRWINAKRNKPGGDRWYAWLSALHTVQAYGRSVRSENDWAYTFVLDSNFNMFVNMNRNILPTWFLDAIKVGQ